MSRSVAKNTIYAQIVMLVLFFAQSARAIDPATLVDKANMSYQSANYQDAIKFYSQALEEGLENADLYYNLGNSYYRNSDLAKAIYYYRKALNLLPNDPDIWANLEYARKDVKEVIADDSEENIVLKILDSLILIKRINPEYFKFYLLAAVFLACLFQLLIIFFEKKNLRVAVYSLYLISFYLLLLILFARPDKNSELKFSTYLNPDSAVIFSPEANVYAGDSKNYQVVAILHQGTELRVLEQRENWVEILLPNKRKGWIEKINIGIV